MAFGLSEQTVERIRQVFSAAPRVRRVRVFGSRALGSPREGSDIDLAVEGQELDLNDLLDLQLGLEKLQLPYRFDLVDVARLTEPALSEHIEKVGVILFER